MKKLIKLFILLGVTTIYNLNVFANNEETTFDICVYGESASGVIAAVQAARMGKNVVLISKNEHVGGLATSGLTATDMNRNDMVGGLTREFYQRVYDYYLKPDVWKNENRDDFFVRAIKRTYRGKNDDRRMQWVYESKVAERIMLDMLEEAGVQLWTNERLDLKKGVKKKGREITEIMLESGKTVRAAIFIDTSYEGDLMAKAGVSYIVGRESNETYNETFNGYRVNHKNGTDLADIDPYIVAGDKSSGLLPYIDIDVPVKQGQADKRVQAYCYRVTLTDDPNNRVKVQKPENYNPLWYEVLIRRIRLNPELNLQNIITLTPMPNRKTDTNHLDFFGASYDYAEADYIKRKEIEQLHRDYALGMLWLLEHDPRIPTHIRDEMKDWGLAKDEFEETGNFPHHIYVREARRMVGEYVMIEKNVTKENREEVTHPIGVGSYALDCHFVSKVVDEHGKLRYEGTIFQPITPYSISYYSMTPKKEECSNLLVPVCLSASHVAISSLRMEPVYMVLGQSAAVAASIAIDARQSVQDISYEHLERKLLDLEQIIKPGNTKPH
ncbi:FAD-dependent oxidoreductase [Sphingobacterium phlebotomi]|uniref:FAD-dependent oxidoreductase n=1 Tax=Sphingobacterium phlebotomi TaxID=2605433 RepID=A0A5D4H2Z9_9SPHI|nr:FAD-dependent oxidoreductase [Sphingobacterium phlebotomi]TYR35421.1 FAD-dependent oxidoreductase [Sphingobacterium phlebotomi]